MFTGVKLQQPALQKTLVALATMKTRSHLLSLTPLDTEKLLLHISPKKWYYHSWTLRPQSSSIPVLEHRGQFCSLLCIPVLQNMTHRQSTSSLMSQARDLTPLWASQSPSPLNWLTLYKHALSKTQA